MKNTKETLMEKTKAELNIELALVGNNITASKLKNTSKEVLVQMIMDAETAQMIKEEVNHNEDCLCDICSEQKLTSENAETQKSVDQLNTELEKRIGENETWTCLICKTETTDFPAVSRRDNKTEICSQCGTNEAIEDFKNKGESNDQKEPTSIDEMFESTMHKKLKDLKLDDAKGLSDVKKAKMKDKPNYDLLYNQFRNALVEQGLNLFVGRNNRDGEMRALTHVKDMQWGVMITKTGIRFELFLQDRTYKMEENTNGIPELNKKINNLFVALKPNAQKTLSTQVPTGRSTRYKICISHEGFGAVEHAKAFSVFHKYLMVGINELYPQETEKKSKTA